MVEIYQNKEEYLKFPKINNYDEKNIFFSGKIVHLQDNFGNFDEAELTFDHPPSGWWRYPKAPVPSRPDFSLINDISRQRAFHKIRPIQVRDENKGQRLAKIQSKDEKILSETMTYFPMLNRNYVGQSFYGPDLQNLFSPIRTHINPMAQGLTFCYGCTRDPTPHYHRDKLHRTGGGFTFFRSDLIQSLKLYKQLFGKASDFGEKSQKPSGVIIATKREVEYDKEFYHEMYLRSRNSVYDGSLQAWRSDRESDDENQLNAVANSTVRSRKSSEDGFENENPVDDIEKNLFLQRLPYTLNRVKDISDVRAVKTKAIKNATNDVKAPKTKTTENTNITDDVSDDVETKKLKSVKNEDNIDDDVTDDDSRKEDDDDGEKKVDDKGGKSMDNLGRTGRGVSAYSRQSTSSSGRKNLYTAPKAFELKKSSKKVTEAKSPFSSGRQLNIPKYKSFQVKKSDKPPTQFINVDVGKAEWKEPEKFELKERNRGSSTTKAQEVWRDSQIKNENAINDGENVNMINEPDESPNSARSLASSPPSYHEVYGKEDDVAINATPAEVADGVGMKPDNDIDVRELSNNDSDEEATPLAINVDDRSPVDDHSAFDDTCADEEYFFVKSPVDENVTSPRHVAEKREKPKYIIPEYKPPSYQKRTPKQKERQKSTTSFPIVEDDVLDLVDPYDWLMRFCIVHPQRLPVYSQVFDEVISQKNTQIKDQKITNDIVDELIDKERETGEGITLRAEEMKTDANGDVLEDLITKKNLEYDVIKDDILTPDGDDVTKYNFVPDSDVKKELKLEQIMVVDGVIKKKIRAKSKTRKKSAMKAEIDVRKKVGKTIFPSIIRDEYLKVGRDKYDLCIEKTEYEIKKYLQMYDQIESNINRLKEEKNAYAVKEIQSLFPKLSDPNYKEKSKKSKKKNS